jgi:hypothetical protein
VAIALRNTATFTLSSGSTPNLTPAWAGGVAPTNGDVMIAVISSIVQSAMTAPAGWTQLTTVDQGSSLRTWAYARVASSEPTSNTWTLGSSAKGFAWVGAYSGASITSTPGWTVATPGGGTAHASAATTVPANGWLVNVGCFRRTATGAASTYTINDASAAERMDFSSNAGSGTDAGGAVYDSNRALTAGSYTRTITSSQSETLDVVYSFVLTPDVLPPLSGSGARWGILI